MKLKTWKQVGLFGLLGGCLALMNFQPLESKAFGGSESGSCSIFIPWEGEGIEVAGTYYANEPMYVIGSDGSKEGPVYKIMQFNPDCPTLQYKYYNSLGSNIFFRIKYGEMTVYAPVPAGYTDDPWSGYGVDFSGIYENANWSGRYGVYSAAGVQMNTVTCSMENVNWSTLTPLSVGAGEVACDSSELVVPAKTNAPTSATTIGGGEWRYIGYTKEGEAVANTYFPVTEAQDADLNQYDYTKDPWNLGFNDPLGRIPTKTGYDEGGNASKKTRAINKLKSQEGITITTPTMIRNLSLRNDPAIDSAVFHAIRTNEDQTAVDGYMMLVNKADPEMLRNLMLESLKLVDYETNETLVTFKRDEPLTYRSEASIEYSLDENGKARRLMGGKTYCLISTVTNAGPSKMVSGLHEVNFRINGEVEFTLYEGDNFNGGEDMTANRFDENGNIYITGMFKRTGLVLGPDTSDDMKFCFEVTGDSGTISIETILGGGYAERGDDLFDVDNDAYLEIDVVQPPKGDLIACDIKLYEASTNKEVKYPRRGVSYYLKYGICYQGTSSQDEELDLYISSDRGPGAVHTDLENGDIYWVETKPFTNNSNKIETQFKIEDPQYDWEINQDKTNDTLSKVFESEINLTITSLKASPDSISSSGSKTITLTTTWTMTAPPGVTDTETVCVQWHFQGNTWNTCGYSSTPGVINQAQTTVTGNFNIDNFTREIVGAYINPEYPADQHVIETTMTDNSAITYINNTGVKESCPIANVENVAEKTFFGTKLLKESYDDRTWEVVGQEEHTTTSWNPVALGWTDGKTCRPEIHTDAWGMKYKYCEETKTTYEDIYDWVVREKERELDPEEYETKRTVSEVYKIVKVQMRSKLTIDRPGDTGADSSGWVTVYERTGNGPTDYKTNPLYIKAGYGIETKITTQYTSDIFSIQSLVLESTSTSWTQIAGTRKFYFLKLSTKGFVQSHTINSDVYLHNPDGLVVSSVNTATTVKGFKLSSGTATKTFNFVNYKKNITDNWSFESDTSIVSANGTDVKTGRIYIDENTRDGLYTFNLETNKIASVLGDEALCDKAVLQVKVVGSVYDDIITNVIE